MASNPDHKYVVLMITFNTAEADRYEDLHLLQSALDKYSNQLTVIPLAECLEEQRSSVVGLFNYGGMSTKLTP